MTRFRRLLTSAALVLALASPAEASMLVFDPSNYAQNLLTAARALQQIQNQITSLQNEAQMLINQARNLATLPFSSLQSITSLFNQIQNLVQQAQHIAYSVQAIDQAFTSQYPKSFTAGTSDLQLITLAKQRWTNTIDAFQDAMHVQAGVVQGLSATQTQTGNLVSYSQSATGALQAMQATNQLLAIVSKQLADLSSLLASQGRAQALQAAQGAASQAQSQEQLNRFLTRARGYQPQTVQMFH